MVSLGGRIAEELVLDDITTGASQDIKQATNIARQMVTRYGMSSSIGTINYEQGGEDVFLGYDIGHENRNSEYMAGEIDKEVRAIISDCYGKAKKIISDHMDVLHSAAGLLMEKEKLTGREFDLLNTLLINKNIVLSRDRLLGKVWGYDYMGETHVVDVYIRYLRSKIDEVYGISLIQTVRGVGYVIRDENEQ